MACRTLVAQANCTPRSLNDVPTCSIHFRKATSTRFGERFCLAFDITRQFTIVTMKLQRYICRSLGMNK